MKRALFVACLLYSTPAFAGDWRLLNLGRSGEFRSVSFIDVDTIRKSGPVIRYWRDIRINGNIGNERYPTNRLVDLVEVDCSERKHRELSSHAFLDSSFTLNMKPDPGWKFAIPDTNMDGEIARVCKAKWSGEPLDRDRAAKAVLEGMERRERE